MKTLLIISLCLAGAIARLAAEEESLVPLSQTPPAVQKTLAAQIGGGTLGEISRSVEGGEASYDVAFTTGTEDEQSFSVDADGKLLSKEVSWTAIPAAVRKTIQIQAAGWGLEGIDRNIEAGGTTYDVEVSKGDETRNLTVDDDGTLLSVTVPLVATPAPVQKAIQAEAAGAQIDSIDEIMDDTQITYDVQAVKAGAPDNFTTGTDGTLLSAEVTLAETPPVVHATIATAATGGTVKSIDRNYDPAAGDTFDVEAAMPDGSTNSFTVGLDGTLLSREVALDAVPPPARATIQAQIGAGKIIRIDQSLGERRKKVLPYDVQGRKAGKQFNFSVGPKGRFLGVDQD